MAGSALCGDLTPLFAGNGRVPLTHSLESVKISPYQGQNEPKLYGAITRESIARVGGSGLPNGVVACVWRSRAMSEAIAGFLLHGPRPSINSALGTTMRGA